MKPWPKTSTSDGVTETTLKSWRDFHEVVQRFLNYPHCIFRGHRMSTWLLESSIARILKTRANYRDEIAKHLHRFQLASRGRRGTNPPQLRTDDDWWSLGQHHGLATPLLDWSTSPYVALFFAMADPPTSDQTDYSSVFALNMKRANEKCYDFQDIDDPDITGAIRFIAPASDENSRLVAQAGMFSRSPTTTDIESWVRKEFHGETRKLTLMRILIPHSERIECLKALNIMNINHSTLFPDLYGAGKYSTELLRRAES